MGSGPGFINSLVVGAHVTRGPTPEPTGFSVHGIGASLIRTGFGDLYSYNHIRTMKGGTLAIYAGPVYIYIYI